MDNLQLLDYLDQLLQADKIKDYCPNGLQIEGKNDIKRVVTGVTASQALIDAAVAQQADAILVHHGYFWKGESPCLRGMKKRRIQALLKHEINLYAYHLPLDVHPELGNNAQLAKLLGIDVLGSLNASPDGVLMYGQLASANTAEQLAETIGRKLARKPLVEQVRNAPVKRVAWCTGGGQGYIQQAAEAGVDAFISGEASEQTIHIAREYGVDFVAAGHHATERYGIKALGEHLADTLPLDVRFIDIDNPV